MARIRTIKPELFRHELLFESEQETGLPLRLAFAGLFCCCDREGRFEWRPRTLKLDVLPYDEIDFSRVLDALATRGFVVKYEVSGVVYGCIPSFTRHQVINNRERGSEYPDLSVGNTSCASIADKNNGLHDVGPRDVDASVTREPRDTETHKGKGREGEREQGKDKGSCPELKNSALPSTEKMVISLPLTAKHGEHNVLQSDFEKYQECFPALDILQELRQMQSWLDANPTNRKTRTGIKAFITRWLSRSQNRAPAQRSGGHQRPHDIDWDDRSWADGLVIEVPVGGMPQ